MTLGFSKKGVGSVAKLLHGIDGIHIAWSGGPQGP